VRLLAVLLVCVLFAGVGLALADDNDVRGDPPAPADRSPDVWASGGGTDGGIAAMEMDRGGGDRDVR
jgi:hypothetical protein